MIKLKNLLLEDYIKYNLDTFNKRLKKNNKKNAIDEPVVVGDKVDFFWNWDKRNGYTTSGTVINVRGKRVQISSMGKTWSVPLEFVSRGATL